jgi:TonB family protein
MMTKLKRIRRLAPFVALTATIFAAACTPKDTTVTQPVALSDSNPVRYPVALWDQHVEGETVLLVHVNARGDVDSTRVEKSSGQAAFDSAASAGARKMRFSPGKLGDVVAAMWTRMPVRFSMDSTAAIGVPVAPDSAQ